MYAGTTSYVLFTLDKLICKFVKQFQALLVDDLAQVSTLHLAEDAHNRLQLCQGDISLSIQDQTKIWTLLLVLMPLLPRKMPF